MKSPILSFILFCITYVAGAQVPFIQPAPDGFEERIRKHIDTMRVFDTHEHLFDPEMLRQAEFLDFALLLLENGFDDLVSSGIPDSLFKKIFQAGLRPSEKWRIIEPYWQNASNTVNNRILLRSIRDLYGVNSLNTKTTTALTSTMKMKYGDKWFDEVIRKRSRIDYVIMDGPEFINGKDYVRYSQRFNPWILVRAKNTIDSLALLQLDPIYTLENYVKSLAASFEKALKNGMVNVKIDIAYFRSISFDNVSTDAARKVFRTIINGNEDFRMSYKDAKPLQDYMVFRLLELAVKHGIPVAFHTGIQAGNGNLISNSNPVLLTNIFREFPGARFVLFHGAYPFGGELSVLAKNFPNVFIDMNWTWSISPAYASAFLDEWLETVPASKIMAFGGDQRMIEMTYGNLVVARKMIADVLVSKVKDGYFSEIEAITIANMILHDNAMRFYNIE